MPFRITRAVKVFLIICVAAFLIQQTADQFFGMNLLSWFALVPFGLFEQYRVWQLVTYAFLHGEVMHLFLNLMMLVFIGGELEAAWGTARFLRYYFLCSISAGLLYALLQHFLTRGTGDHTPMVGASGAIYGLLMAYGLIFGERVLLFMLLFPMKAKHFVWILAAIEFMTTVFSGGNRLAGVAHLGGMAAGFTFLWGRATLIVAQRNRHQNRLLNQKAKRRRAAQHLKLIINNARNRGAVPPGDETEDPNNPKTWH